MKNLIVILATVLVTACAAPKMHHTSHKHSSFELKPEYKIRLQANLPESNLFRGEPSQQNASNSYNMMYPGGAGLAGFIAGIATHAAIESSKQNNLKQQQLERDNQILESIRPSIDAIDLKGLPHFIEPKLLSDANISLSEENAEYVLGLNPLFFISPDYSTVRIKNIVSLKKSALQDSDNDSLYTNLIEMSYLVEGDNSRQLLSENLAEIIEKLLMDSTNLGIQDISGKLSNDGKMATFKIGSGDNIRYERGNLIQETCDYLTIRNLRKWLISVPRSMNHNSQLECAI